MPSRPSFPQTLRWRVLNPRPGEAQTAGPGYVVGCTGRGVKPSRIGQRSAGDERGSAGRPGPHRAISVRSMNEGLRAEIAGTSLGIFGPVNELVDRGVG